MPQACLVCERIALIREGRNPTFIAELPSGYAVMGDEQFLPGYCLLLAREHVTELHHLPRPDREQFLRDMSALGEAVSRALGPTKMNYAILGNLVAHLHCHVHARYPEEPDEYRRGPVSAYPQGLRHAPETRFDPARHGALIAAIRQQLHTLSE